MLTTRDHAPPKCLLEKPLPKTLITVPSCRACNEGFAKDEEYFATVLAHIGSAPELAAKVDQGGVVDRALTRRPLFSEMIENALSVDRDGRVFFMPDEDRLESVVRKIAIGLFARRFQGVTPPAESFRARLVHDLAKQDSGPPDEILLMVHDERFVPKPWQIVQAGTFGYVFVRIRSKPTKFHCLLNFYDTLWADVECPWPAGNSGRSKTRGQPPPRCENKNQLRLLTD